MAAPPLPVNLGETCTSCDGHVEGEHEVTAKDIADHCNEQSCWVVLYGAVWDLTPFLKDHPAGPGAILEFAGRDATVSWESLHPPEVLSQLSPSLRIGVVDKNFDAELAKMEASQSISSKLLESCRMGGTTEVDALLESRADPNYQGGPSKEAPLHWAARKGLADMTVALLAASASPATCDLDGQTPLHIAARNSQRDVIKVLLEATANINAADKRGETPLHAVAAVGSVRLVRLLLDAGADPALQDLDGNSAAATAAEQGHSTAEQLIEDRMS